MSSRFKDNQEDFDDVNSPLRHHSQNQHNVGRFLEGDERMDSMNLHGRKKHRYLRPVEEENEPIYHFVDNETEVPEGQNVVLFDLNVKSNNSVILTETEAAN